MPAPTTVDDFLQFARKSGQLDGTRLDDYLEKASEELPASPRKMAVRLIRAGVMLSSVSFPKTPRQYLRRILSFAKGRYSSASSLNVCRLLWPKCRPAFMSDSVLLAHAFASVSRSKLAVSGANPLMRTCTRKEFLPSRPARF